MEDWSVNPSVGRQVWLGMNPLSKQFVDWNRSDQRITDLQSRISESFTANQHQMNGRVDRIVEEFKRGNIKDIESARQMLKTPGSNFTLDDRVAVKQLVNKITGWQKYDLHLKTLTDPMDIASIPDRIEFQRMVPADSDFKAKWIRENMESMSEEAFDVFKRIGSSYGVVNSISMQKFDLGFEMQKAEGVRD